MPIKDIKISKKGIKICIVNSIDQELVEFIKDALVPIDIIIEENYLVIVLDNSDISLVDLIDSINSEYDQNISLYESGKIYNLDSLECIFNICKEMNRVSGYYYNFDLINYLKDKKDLKNYSSHFLGSINKNEEMEQFIGLFLENDLNGTLAAKNGYMHRNTINYKLNQIKIETGLDIRRFKDAMAIFYLIH